MPTASTAILIIPPLPQNNKNRAFARFFVYGRAEATRSVNSQKIYAISADYRLPRAGKYVMMGKMIYNSDNHSDNMEEVNACLSNLGEGVYFVKVIVNESNYTSKLIKY